MLKLYVWLKDMASRAREEAGQDMVDYALLTGIMAIIILAVLFGVLNGALQGWVNGVADAIADKPPVV